MHPTLSAAPDKSQSIYPCAGGPVAVAGDEGARNAAAGGVSACRPARSRCDDYVTSDTDVERRSLPDDVFGMLPGPSTTTLRGRISTSATTSCAT